MAIEFRCQQCGRLLRVPDEAGGRQAQCPQCHTEMRVPLTPPAAEPPRPTLEPAQAWGAPAGNPYQPSPWGGDPMSDAQRAARAAESVAAPAIALMIAAGLSMAVSVVMCGGGIIAVLNQPMPGNPNAPLGLMLAVVFGMYFVMPVAQTAVVFVGAMKMRKLESYGLSMAGCIVALLPCNFCWLLTLPFGIWAIVVLSDTSVRGAFKR
jgi:hypothetical protein